MASGSFYNYPTGNFGIYCTWESTIDKTNSQSIVVLKTYLSYHTISVNSNSKCTTSINGNSETFTSPSISVSSASSWTKKLINTRTETVKHNSDGKKKVTLSASYPFNGTYSGVSIGTITASKTVTLDNIITDCTAPTTFTVTSDNVDDNGYNKAFESKITLKWSGAKSGIGNDITGYQIQYATNSDKSTWNYANLQKVTSTSKSGSVTIDMSSKVPRGNYVRFRIQVLGEAGSSYYSTVKVASYAHSSGDTGYSVKRNPYTDCTEPKTFTASSNNFDSTVILKWSGAKGGSSNPIVSYYIQYATSSNNSTWSKWVGLTTVNSTATSGSYSVDMSSKITRGHWVKFRIRTQGKISGYYSDYTASSSIRRQPYTNCIEPDIFTVIDTNSASTSEFKVKLSWSDAGGGIANSISSYYIQYATSSNNSTWSKWVGLTTVNSTATSGSYSVDMSSKITRGHWVKFRIRTQGKISGYYSDYKTTSSIQRNPYTNCKAPTSVTIISDKSNYPFENSITINWSDASGGVNNNISSYLIRYATSSDNKIWSAYADLATIPFTLTSGSKIIDVSDKVPRGYYIKVAIRTQGDAVGGDYSSPYKYSSSLQRNPYTKCSPPKNVILLSNLALGGVRYRNTFESDITFTITGARAGENNPITGYAIQFRTSNNGSDWSSWIDYSKRETTQTDYSYTTSAIGDTNILPRGWYVQFRVQTMGIVETYNSDYIITEKIRKNSIPSVIPNITLSSSEYSYGNSIIVNWEKPIDIDNNIYKYQVIAYQNVNGSFVELFTEEVVGADNIRYVFDANNSYYNTITNNQQIKFAVKAIDVFQLEATSHKYSSVIARYDNTGVFIGVDGKWIDCQIYVGTNGQWVEQSMCAGVNNTWLQCELE